MRLGTVRSVRAELGCVDRNRATSWALNSPLTHQLWGFGESGGSFEISGSPPLLRVRQWFPSPHSRPLRKAPAVRLRFVCTFAVGTLGCHCMSVSTIAYVMSHPAFNSSQIRRGGHSRDNCEEYSMYTTWHCADGARSSGPTEHVPICIDALLPASDGRMAETLSTSAVLPVHTIESQTERLGAEPVNGGRLDRSVGLTTRMDKGALPHLRA